MAAVECSIECVHCGSDQLRVDVSGECRSCGWAIADSINIEVIDADSLTVATDVACIGCDYNLRTLRIDALCPECAKPVVESLRPNDLHFADTKWLRRVRAGVTSLLVAMLVAFMGFMLSAAAPVFLAFPPGGRSPFRFVLHAFVILGSAVLVLTFGGTYLTATPDRRGQGPPLRLQTTTRLLVVLTVLLATTYFVVLVSVRGPLGFLAALIIGGLVPIAAIGVGVCVLACLRRIAVRARRTTLRRRTTVLMWVIALGGLASVSTGIVSSIQRGGLGPVVRGTAPRSLRPAPPGIVGPPAPPAAAAPAAPSLPQVTPLTVFTSCVLPLLFLLVGVSTLVTLFKYRALLSSILRSQQPRE